MARTRPTRTRPMRDQRPAYVPGADDADDAELIEVVREFIDRERLHVPPPLEEDPVDLPFDLTTVSDTQLQQLYSAFAAYSYRAGYLLALEEAKEHKYKDLADEIVQAHIARNSDDETVTKLKAQAEQIEQVKRWRSRQRRSGILAAALRKDRDNYDKVCERLSRIETMRHDEWLRSGGGPIGKRGRS